MSNKTKASRLLSYILRHGPADYGLTLDSQGWVAIESLLSALTAKGVALSNEVLHQIVREDEKQRYSVSEDGLRIRANQGHSIAGLALDFTEARPPDVLYHGTVVGAQEGIKAEGLKPMGRHHVHLAADHHTAFKVATRRKPLPGAIWCIDAKRMAADGHKFWVSDNGVWLADSVPVQYLTLEPGRWFALRKVPVVQ